MLLSDNVVQLQKKCYECWVMGYLVRYPTHPPHSVRKVIHGQQMQASRECLFLSDCNAPFQVHVGKVVFDPDIDADIPPTQRWISIARTTVGNKFHAFYSKIHDRVCKIPQLGPSVERHCQGHCNPRIYPFLNGDRRLYDLHINIVIY
jgi:hypothetical protein